MININKIMKKNQYYDYKIQKENVIVILKLKLKGLKIWKNSNKKKCNEQQ